MIKSQKTLIIIMKSLLNNVLYQNLEELMIFSIISISSSSQLPQCCILHISDSPSRVLCKQNSIEHESMEDTNNCSRFQCKRCISSQGSELPYTHLSYTFSSLTCKSISWSRSSSFVNFSCLPEVCSGRKNSGNFHTHL